MMPEEWVRDVRNSMTKSVGAEEWVIFGLKSEYWT